MPRPGRRAALLPADLMTDGRFLALGKEKQIGVLAQLLFVLVQPFADDQGRLEADPEIVKARAAVFVHRLAPNLIQKCLEAIHRSGLGILYELDGLRVLQIVDWHQWNPNLRHKEPSDLPPDPDWNGDDIRPWQDDAKVKASRAWKETRKSLEDSELAKGPARRDPQAAGRERQSSPPSLKSKSEVEVENKSELSQEEMNAPSGTTPGDGDESIIQGILETVDRALKQNRKVSQDSILSGKRAERAATKIRAWLSEGIPAAWLKSELERLCRNSSLPIKGLGFFDTPVREDWQETKASGGARPLSAPPQRVQSAITEDPTTGRLLPVFTRRG